MHSATTPLHGSGFRNGLYSRLISLPRQSLDVVIPDTVCFENGCPRAWFFYDFEFREVRRRPGRDLQIDTIAREFLDMSDLREGDWRRAHASSTANTSGSAAGSGGFTGVHPVATYTHTSTQTSPPAAMTGVVDEDAPVVTVLFLDAEALTAFLNDSNDPRKNSGFLQRYCPPRELHETTLQVSWSPSVCVVRRRGNFRLLTDINSPTLAHKHVTFEGPDTTSRELVCARDTAQRATSGAEAVVRHIRGTTRQEILHITLYMKLDPEARLVLLWCAGAKVAGHVPERVPQAVFSCPAIEQLTTVAVSAALRQANASQNELERAIGLVEKSGKWSVKRPGSRGSVRSSIASLYRPASSPSPPRSRPDTAFSEPSASTRGPVGGSRSSFSRLPPMPTPGGTTGGSGVFQRPHSRGARARRSTTSSLLGAVAAPDPSEAPCVSAVVRDGIVALASHWYNATPEARAAAEHLRRAEQAALRYVEDGLYEAHSRVQQAALPSGLPSCRVHIATSLEACLATADQPSTSTSDCDHSLMSLRFGRMDQLAEELGLVMVDWEEDGDGDFRRYSLPAASPMTGGPSPACLFSAASANITRRFAPAWRRLEEQWERTCLLRAVALALTNRSSAEEVSSLKKELC